MGALLLLAIWIGVAGYALVYHGTAVLGGQNISFWDVATGKAG